MQYLGDPDDYTRKELIIARKIRAMEESPEKEKRIKEFREETGKMFPIQEPGTLMSNTSPISALERNSPEYDKNINELCRNPHKYNRGKLF